MQNRFWTLAAALGLTTLLGLVVLLGGRAPVAGASALAQTTVQPSPTATAQVAPKVAAASPAAPTQTASRTAPTRTTAPATPRATTPSSTRQPNTGPSSTPTVGPYSGTPTAPFPTIIYSSPAITSVQGIWLGEMKVGANIRTGPGITYPVNRVWPAQRRVLVYSSAAAANGETWYQVSHYPDPTLYVHSDFVVFVAPLTVPTQMRVGRWVDVNLTQQTLIAYQDSAPVLLAQIASGKKGHETTVGVWPIYYRLPLQDMDGGGTGPKDPYYNLKDVPWIQYFHMSGEGLHGAYWHDMFGRPRSHGCVNLSIQNSNWLYLWGQMGIPVVVHN